jgi:hypothetical protein
MGKITVNRIFCSVLLLVAAALILNTVVADNGTITIAYRGSGGSSIGDTVVFDGRNTYGNTILLKITGPGLPSQGVPVNNLNGPSGTATSVGVDLNGMWKFVWYASGIPGLDKLQTARYTFIATDSENPAASATTSLLLKKPEFYITVSPNPSNPGDYIELIGTAEQGINSAKIDIADASGTVLHTFTSPVGSSGYLSYGFHGDLGPGQYTVTVSNPTLKAPYRTLLTVVAPESVQSAGSVPALAPESAGTTTDMAGGVTTDVRTVSVAEPVPTRSPVASVTILASLMAGLIIVRTFRRS